MLPDYPALKNDLADLLNRLFRRRLAQYQGFVGQVAKQRVFEGDKSFIQRPTGDSETTDFEDFSVSREIAAKDIPKMTFYDVLNELDAAAAEMGEKTAKFFYAGLDRTLEAAGQVESAKGEPISPEQILRVMERIEMNFDDDGKNQLSLVIHPSQTEKFAAALRRLEEDPVMRQRHEDLLARKKEAWRVREASRRLVG
jgi:hypothetical protein